jgi:hypothetical protein
MKCPKTPLRTVAEIGANPHGNRAPDTSDTLKTAIDQAPKSLAEKALAILHDRLTVTQQAQAELVADPAEGDIIAVLIDSAVLGAPIWFALRDGWQPDEVDGIPVFYASELPVLRLKSAEQLRSIFNVKPVFGGGMVQR